MQIQYRRQLLDLLKELNLPLIGAELGVAEGLHSNDLLVNGMEKLFLVDAWEFIPKIRGDGNNHQTWHDQNFQKVKSITKRFEGKAVILRGRTVDMADKVKEESLSLLYIDADHSYNGVMNDLIAWVPKVIKGGVVAMHDYEAVEYGVKQAVQDFCRDKYDIHLIPEDKKEDAGAWFQKT